MTIMIFSSQSPSAGVVRAISRGRICNATSLNAQVGPLNNSMMKSLPSGLTGVMRSSLHWEPYASAMHWESSSSV